MLSFVAEDPALALGGCTILVADGGVPGRCDLTIAMGTDTATWRSLPRKAELMTAALASRPRPSTGSRLVGLNAGGLDSVPNGTARPATAGRGCRWRAEMPGGPSSSTARSST
ncbi:hypothetical protein AB0D97_20830 [Streptomyces roseus]|uniref:hypothetical protein n=1 Tax=Streptomyces roseus TaxID=66430 RepID=UPI0033D5089D